MNFCVVLRTPFKRICQYQFDTKEEARRFVLTLGAILETEIEADIVPAELISQYYDA